MKSARNYQREIRALKQRVKTLERRLYGIVAETYPYTLERDMKAGHTIFVRVPKPFMIRDE